MAEAPISLGPSSGSATMADGGKRMSFKKRRQSSSNRTAERRPSFASILRRPFSRLSQYSDAPTATAAGDDDAVVSQLGHNTTSLPNMILPPTNIQPLPLLPLICLCLAMLAEFLSASTPAAFLFFQIQSFYVPEGETDPPDGVESQVAFWSGIVGSVFFLSQFLTGLLWAEVEKKHGCRAVLIVSLAGNAISLTLFGRSKNLASAIVARLGQGLFAGAVGVARSAVKNITVESNESQAYTFVGLAWGLGGIVGSIIGGLCEHPVKNYPFLFGRSQLFAEYPYLLPCLVSSSITLTGAFLCLFLGRDGGPRSGAIKLPVEKVTEEGQAVEGDATPKPRPRPLSKRVSSYFSLPTASTPKASRDASYHALHRPESPSYGTHLSTPAPGGAASTSVASPESTPRKPRASMSGTSYGYTTSHRPSRPWSRRFTMESARRGSMGTQYAPDFEGPQEPDLSSLNFAQRLLLANEPTVVNISDLWVQACAAQTFDEEEEDFYHRHDTSQADLDQSVFEQDDDADQTGDFSTFSEQHEAGQEEEEEEQRESSPFLAAPSPSRLSGFRKASHNKPPLGALGLNGLPNVPQRPRLVSRQSTASSAPGRPRIFSNSGLSVQSPLFSPAAEAAPQQQWQPPQASVDANPLATIDERHQSGRLSPVQSAQPLVPPPAAAEPAESPFKHLPKGIILQYFVVAFHSTATDQVFNTFLVTPVASGGLGLTASHFAELVAALFFAQMFFQSLYGKVGPPNGKLTHLTMLRLGMCIYIPTYLLYPALRNLLHETSNFFVMTGMIILASIRIWGNVCCYTSLMVLVNILTPPHLLGLSNALAQSTASAARFFGPVVGASVWSWSIGMGPTGRSFPFDYHFGFVCVSFVSFVGLVLSSRLK